MQTVPSITASVRRTSSRLALCATLLLAASGASAQGQNQIVSLGFTPSFEDPVLPAVAPGEIMTLFTMPLGVPDAVATQTPLPNSLSGVSVLVRVVGAQNVTGYPASLPILRVFSESKPEILSGYPCSLVVGPTPVLCSYTQITVEIPTERVCAPTTPAPPENCTAPPFHDWPPMLVLNVEANGVTGPDMPVQVGEGGHYLNSCDAIFGPQASSTCQPLITHADGTLVSDDSPAKVGETIALYSVGYGPNVATGYAATVPIPELLGIGSGFTFSYPTSGAVLNGLPGSMTTTQVAVPLSWAGLLPGYVGLYQFNVTVPPRPNANYQCGGYTYPNQPGNAQILADTPLYICVVP